MANKIIQLKDGGDNLFPTAPNDYIVNQGTSGDWTYRKFNSGIAECWATLAITKSGSSTSMLGLSGKVYESGAINYPISFTSAPMVMVAGNVGGQNTVIVYTRNGASDFAVEMVANPVAASSQMNIFAIIRGRWK